MSTEEEKIVRSRRILQKETHVKYQYKIAKQYQHTKYLKQPHRLHKQHAMDCGQPGCMLCGNPRRTYRERTVQEKRFEQTKEWID